MRSKTLKFVSTTLVMSMIFASSVGVSTNRVSGNETESPTVIRDWNYDGDITENPWPVEWFTDAPETTVKPTDKNNTSTTTTGSFGTNVKVSKTKVKKLTNKKGKKITVKLKKVKKVTGYKIRYATNKKLKKAKTRTSKKATYTLKKLKKGKRYYIKARAYIKANGKTYYSKWSKVKSVKVTK